MDAAGMDLTALKAEMSSLEEQMARMRDGYADLQRAMAELSVSVTSADGQVTVAVDARGHVVSVELDPKIYQRPDSRMLAATITATIQQAEAEVMEQVTELSRPYLPEGTLDGTLDLDSMFPRGDFGG